jgi:glycerol kinase
MASQLSIWHKIADTGTDRSTALGAAILAGASMKLFGWDISKPETLDRVNTSGSTSFTSQLDEKEREQKWKGWKKAVGRSLKWADAIED